MSYVTVVSANFARPADTTAYASGDLVANSTTAGSVVALTFVATDHLAGPVFIRRVRLKKSAASLTSASFRLHLYQTAPTPANGDNGAWSTTESGYLGSVDITCDRAFSDPFAKGVGVPNNGSEISGAPVGGSATIYGLLEARGAYTPASGETFAVELEIWKS